jgi:hypothetical protein
MSPNPKNKKGPKSLKISSLSKTFGGAERSRTADPLLAKQVLYQLSYSPTVDNWKISRARLFL